MRVILRDDVVGLGDIGQEVNVKSGYARNYLIPQELAIEAGSKNASAIAHQMKQIEKRKNQKKVECEKIAEGLRDIELVQELRVTSGGKVFGSVTNRMIAEALQGQDYDIDRRRVLLADPIKKLGVHFVGVKLHPEVQVQIKVNVKEKAATEEEEQAEAQKLKATLEENTDQNASNSEEEAVESAETSEEDSSEQEQ